MKPFGISVIGAERGKRVENIAKEDRKCRGDKTSNQGEDRPEYESRQMPSSRESEERFPSQIAFGNIFFVDAIPIGSLAFGQHFGERLKRHTEGLV